MSHNNPNLDQQHNTARYFVETPQVAWAALLGVLVWGVFGYTKMPQRKDPEIPVRDTLVIATWPGMPAERIEQLITKQVEEKIAQNAKVTDIKSTTKEGVAYIFATIDEEVNNSGQELDDLSQKLKDVTLPEGALPLQYVKDFGDTATLMLTVASPRVDDGEINMRRQAIRAAVAEGERAVVWPHARSFDPTAVRQLARQIAQWLADGGTLSGARVIAGDGFTAIAGKGDKPLGPVVERMLSERLNRAELHPDVWAPVFVGEGDWSAALARQAGPKYTYAQLDRFTETIEKNLKTLSMVGKVNRSAVLGEQIELTYSQERWGGSMMRAGALRDALNARSNLLAGGQVESSARVVNVVANADFRAPREIGNLLLPAPNGGAPVRLSDMVTIERGYESPARFLNYHQWKDASGQWQRARAVTLDIQMRSGMQIQQFNEQVNAELTKIKALLPADVVLDRTSDQPLQVRENVDLFMRSLWEAVALVVLVSLIGFWEWRSALLMALAIPITLAMTFGMMHLLGIDIQQVSIASLIIALGLLVDDPVVAGDAIKRELAAGRPRMFAAWQGPTKLGRAILFATVTNIVSYLPFLMLGGDNRRFLYTLPIVMTCALIASRLVSMTFIPMLGHYLLRPKAEKTIEERRVSGFGGWYYKVGGWAIDHRWLVLGLASLLVIGSFRVGGTLKQQFFPYERQYLSFVDVWLPEDAPLSATARATEKAENVIRRVADQQNGKLKSLTAWIGGGGPRYWLSSSPEPNQTNYAHILVQVSDPFETDKLLPLWQQALTNEVPGALIDVRRLETSAPVGVPVQLRVSGTDLNVLRAEAAKLRQALEATGIAARVRDDWGNDALGLDMRIDDQRLIEAGLTRADVANSLGAALSGAQVGTYREGDRTLPIVMKLRMDERARVNDLSQVYVYANGGATKVPLSQVAKLEYKLQPARISRYQQFRTITVMCFPVTGKLPSEVLEAAQSEIDKIAAQLPAGVKFEIAGEFKEQMKGFGQLAVVMAISVMAIFFALVIQFRHAIKPLIVFAAIPFGIGGALVGLAIMGAPFGFMAFLGVASLIGVIVSHIIVLFDFIEEKHEEGAPLREALLDAGILRLRPVLVTVGATVIALVPLARNGGPLWEPLCYTQIAGLTVSTVITLVLVPVVYAIFVQDLKLVKWTKIEHA
jgi:multidrug efflux pump subunit AcrB